jgi:nucleoid-associated protein EbfC
VTSSNPFEALGAGGLDMGALLAQAQAMQTQMQQAQVNLAAATFDGEVAGGLVKATVSGVGELVGVAIDPTAVSGTSADDLAELGDLIVAAYRTAKQQADEVASAAMGAVSGGLDDALKLQAE